MAEETGCAPLDATLVQQAWSDLQQLPAPWNHDGAATAKNASLGSSVIEFGELDGDGGSFDYELADEDDYEADDEMPASIPIASGRPGRHILAVDPLDVTLDTAELLLESFDHFEEFGTLELRAADPPEPAPAEEPEQPAASNPFAEPFDEEEIVLDPYAAFESELLRTAPQVINRLDRAFASELHRCVQMATSKPAPAGRPSGGAKPAAASAAASAGTALLEQPIRLHETRVAEAAPASPAKSAASDLLIIEDDDATTAAVVQGRQFRRLFSNLESASKSHLA
jgi:hypothetical protein